MNIFITPEKHKYGFYFEYEKEHVPAKVDKPKSQGHDKPVSTTATVLKLHQGEGEPVLAGEGNCRVHYLDRFEYKKGRKEALKRALNDAKLTRSERKYAWISLHCGAKSEDSFKLALASHA